MKLHHLRGFLFFAFLVFILFGPFYRQVLDGEMRMFREWTMFHSIAANVIELEFEEFSNNQWQDFEYLTPLKNAHGISNNRSLQLNDPQSVDLSVKYMCSLFANKQLRVSARLGSITDGWVELRNQTPVQCDQY